MRLRHACLWLVTILGAFALLAQERSDHIITGNVREEGSNDPIPAVTLEISQSGSQAQAQVMSGMDGGFVFRGLQEGDYVITAKKNGFDTASVTGSVVRTGGPEVTITLRRTAAAGVHPGGPISTHQLQVPKKARAAYEKGYTLLAEKNKPAESIPAFEKAVKEYPSYYEAYTELGIANNHVGKVPEAEASFKKAVELSDGTFLQPLYLLADLNNSHGKYQEAEPFARQAIALDSSAWNGFFELARSLLGLKRISEAETSAVQARDLSPQTPQIYLILANIHALQQKYPAAVQDLDAYLKLVPDSQNNESVRRTRDKLQKQVHTPPDTNPFSTPKAATPQP
jgi:Flp pilus assembly protein TadD